MKKFLVFILSYILTSCGVIPGDPVLNSTWEEVQQMRSGTVTLMYVPSDGFSYIDEDGRLTGVTIEIMRDFIDFVNVQYDVDVTIHYQAIEQFSSFYETVRDTSGGIFGVANVTITEERKSELAFSPPYMMNIATLITHSDVDEISGFNEISRAFAGLKALAFEGTLHQDRLEKIVEQYMPQTEIVFAGSNNEIIERVSSGNSYFAYVDIYNYWRAINSEASLQRHSAGDEASEKFGIIMPLESDWHHLVRRFFEDEGGYLNTERYRFIMETHLGKELADVIFGYNSRI